MENVIVNSYPILDLISSLLVKSTSTLGFVEAHHCLVLSIFMLQKDIF